MAIVTGLYDFPTITAGLTFYGLTMQINVSGSPKDMTGCKLKFKFTGNKGNIYVLSDDEGLDITDIATGVIVFPQIDKFEWIYDVYYYCFTIEEVDGTINEYLKGKWTIKNGECHS